MGDDVILDGPYATAIGKMDTKKTSIYYTKITSIHQQTLSKKYTSWKFELNNLSVRSLFCSFVLLLLFFDKRDDFANKYEDFYNPSINKTLVMIDGMSLQLHRDGLQA